MARTQIQLGALTGSLGTNGSDADVRAAIDYASIAGVAAMTPENNAQQDLAGILQLSFDALARINGKADPLTAAKGAAYHTDHQFYLDDGSTQVASLQTGLFSLLQAGTAIQIGDGSGGMGISHANGVLAADAELAGVSEGTSDHLGHADDSLVISNLVDDGDIHFMVSDGGNSKGLLKLQASDGSVRIGGGATVYADTFAELTTDGDINFSNDIKLGNSKQIILQDDDGDDVVFGVSNGTTDYRMMLPTAAGSAGQVLKIASTLGAFNGEANADLQLAWQNDSAADPEKYFSAQSADLSAAKELDLDSITGPLTDKSFVIDSDVVYKKVDVYLNGQLLRVSSQAAARSSNQNPFSHAGNAAIANGELGTIIQLSSQRGGNLATDPVTRKFCIVDATDSTFAVGQPVSSIAAANITVGNDSFELNGHGFETGDRVRLTLLGTLTGITTSNAGESYFAIKIDVNNFKLATTRANSAVPTPITLSGSPADSSGVCVQVAKGYISEGYVLQNGDCIGAAGGNAAAATTQQLRTGDTDNSNSSALNGRHDDMIGSEAFGAKAGATRGNAFDYITSLRAVLAAIPVSGANSLPELVVGAVSGGNGSDATPVTVAVSSNLYQPHAQAVAFTGQKPNGNEAIGGTVPTIAGATFQLATLTGGVAVEHDYAQGSDEEAIVFSFPLRKDDVVNVIKRA